MGKKKNHTMKNVSTNLESVSYENKNEEVYVPRNYARSQVQPLWALTPKNSTSRKYTEEQIDLMLKNPYINYSELQSVSNYLLYNSPMYNNFIDYISNLITWDYVLYCEDGEDQYNRYRESAKILRKINVKTIFPSLLKSVIANGECYFYNLSDGKNNIIMEIDSSYCQLAQIDDNNIWRYYIDVSKIEFTRLYEFPEEIQSYYKQWIEKKKPKTKKEIDGIEIPEYLYQVSDNGWAVFSHMRKEQHDYPYLAPMFGDLAKLEDDKDYMNDYIKESNIKLIHMKVPTDKETGKPLMGKDTIQVYHESAKEHLPRNCAPLTNPFEVDGIALDKAQDKAINLVDYSTKVVMQDSGISESIFNADTTLGLQYSTLADSAKLYPLIYFFENFLNLQIKKYGAKVSILKINYHNQIDWHKEYRSDLLSGGSRMLFISSTGIEPYDFINMVETEKSLDFDSMLIPKMNASQMNQDAGEVGQGREPKDAKESSDSTNKEKEYR